MLFNSLSDSPINTIKIFRIDINGITKKLNTFSFVYSIRVLKSINSNDVDAMSKTKAVNINDVDDAFLSILKYSSKSFRCCFSMLSSYVVITNGDIKLNAKGINPIEQQNIPFKVKVALFINSNS